MIYEIGTISTKANDPKITGKNTLWKNSVTKVSVGQIILIQSGNAIYQNSIRSVESDTQMTLSFPVPVALTDVKYVISITMIGSVSDGVNKATAMVTESYQLMMILNRLMTESGVIKVVLPDGTEMQLRTEKERDRLLDGKFDKAGGAVTGPTTFNHTNIRVNGTNDWTSLRLIKQDGSYAMLQTNPASYAAMLSITNRDKDEKTLGLVSIPNRSGTAMLVGDFGVGEERETKLGRDYRNCFISYSEADAAIADGFPTNGTGLQSVYAAARRAQIFMAQGRRKFYSRFSNIAGADTETIWNEHYTTANTTKDAQGNLRAASPIVKVFADHIETNDESEGVTLEKLGVGRYKLKGVLGMNSDASWGGFNGGIVIPKGINGLELVWADYKVLSDGDIILETHYRKHADLPPPVVLNRLIAYPEFMDENGNELESYTPCDIPNGHWIDIRVQMPSNSIYNQKQAEAERLAKLEAERLAQEEAKRVAEEAESAEQEDQNEA
ncbi:hypothetical protein VCB84_001961 [Providencia rettgeri]|nr:hypothetical protein [Providencia rettgeri]EJD6643052.1 hypothetical protein [Providencia rettgeri]ELL9155516.1 hypothetical protein [Providencia rettgeri]ELR5048808.1 hypothetical protein [Providencia rettgeri]ELR5063699.1 hypothetical protein [Providencia rettgeri]